MPKNFFTQPQNIKLIIFGVVIIGSGVARVAKVLGEQAKKREAIKRREQMELENLRTGNIQVSTQHSDPQQQSPQQAQQSARATLEEMAAKRREQIEELRRRRQAAGAAQVRSAPSQTQSAGRSRSAATAPQGRTPFTPRPVAAQKPAQAPQQRQEKELVRGQRARESVKRDQQVAARMGDREAKTVAAGQAIARGAPGVPVAEEFPMPVAAETQAQRQVRRKDLVFTRGDIRRAIVTQEIIAPPLSLR